MYVIYMYMYKYMYKYMYMHTHSLSLALSLSRSLSLSLTHTHRRKPSATGARKRPRKASGLPARAMRSPRACKPRCRKYCWTWQSSPRHVFSKENSFYAFT